MTEEIVSQQIQSLKDRLSSGEPGAEAAFWDDVSSTGTPLAEAIEGDDRCRRAHRAVFLTGPIPSTIAGKSLWQDARHSGRMR